VGAFGHAEGVGEADLDIILDALGIPSSRLPTDVAADCITCNIASAFYTTNADPIAPYIAHNVTSAFHAADTVPVSYFHYFPGNTGNHGRLRHTCVYSDHPDS